MSYPNYPPYGQQAPQNYPPYGQQAPPSYASGYSPESGIADFDNAFSDKTVRQGFIRKVYSILFLQLLISFGSVILFTTSNDLKMFATKNGWLLIVAFLVSICTICPMICVQSLRRKTPHNYILLVVFTLAESVLLGFVGAFSSKDLILLAVGITAFVVLGLTIFAFQTKWDFTALNGVMFCVLMCFTLAGFVMMFFRNVSILNLIYSSIGALIFSIYIVMDTQSIVGGNNRKYQVSSEEYIFASLILYLDVINLFTYILSILNEANK